MGTTGFGCRRKTPELDVDRGYTARVLTERDGRWKSQNKSTKVGMSTASPAISAKMTGIKMPSGAADPANGMAPTKIQPACDAAHPSTTRVTCAPAKMRAN